MRAYFILMLLPLACEPEEQAPLESERFLDLFRLQDLPNFREADALDSALVSEEDIVRGLDRALTVDAVSTLDIERELDTASTVDTAVDTAQELDTALTADVALAPSCGEGSSLELESWREGRFLRLPEVPADPLLPRPVTIYLPEAYDQEPERRFPVLYLHDGQNLFDPALAFMGVAWELDSAAQALVELNLIEPFIAVGVHNSAQRIGDYTPSRDPSREEGGGAADYGHFLVEVLKPWVDQHLRTHCAREETGVMGSSLGGLVSLYLLREYPEIFGRVGLISPSLWWNGREALGWSPQILNAWRADTRLWIDVGSLEGEDPDGDGQNSMAEESRTLRDMLLEAGLSLPENFGYLEEQGAAHNEASWAARLPEMLIYLWGDPGQARQMSLWSSQVPVPLGGRAVLGAEVTFEHLRMTVPAEFESSAPEIFSLEGDRLLAQAAGQAQISAHWRGLSAEENLEAQALPLIRFQFRVPASTPPNAQIYIAGGGHPLLGEWRPDGLALEEQEGLWRGELNLPINTELLFKLTRGSWETVEKGAEGQELENRHWLVQGEALIEGEVLRWADQ